MILRSNATGIALVTVAVVLCLPVAANVQSASASSSSSSNSSVGYAPCRNELDWIAWKEQRKFRAALFGLTKAEDAGVAEVRFSTEDKSIWIKTQRARSSTSSSPALDGEWESVAEGFESTTWSDDTMDSFSDIPTRNGIFGTRRRVSTELIPHLAQAYRTLECRLEGLCRLLDLSLTVNNPVAQDVTVKILGCLDVPTKTLPACHLPVQKGTLPTQGNLKSYCIAMSESMRVREAQILKLVSEYDAGYRTSLQFSGIFRSFLGQMRGVVMGSIRSATQMITSFSRVPCFLGACDENPSALDP